MCFKPHVTFRVNILLYVRIGIKKHMPYYKLDVTLKYFSGSQSMVHREVELASNLIGLLDSEVQSVWINKPS